MANVCLLVLCGIPGAGKSTWVQHFLKYIKESDFQRLVANTGVRTNESSLCSLTDGRKEGEHTRTGETQEQARCTSSSAKEGGDERAIGKSYQVINVAFDDLISEDLEAGLVQDAKLQNMDKTKSITWKICRKAIANCVEHLTEELCCTKKTENVNNTSHYEAANINDTQPVKSSCQSNNMLNNYSPDSSTGSHVSDTSHHSKKLVLTGDKPYSNFTNTENIIDKYAFNSSNSAEDASGLESGLMMAEKLKKEFEKLVRPQMKEPVNADRWILVIDDNMYYTSMRYEFFQIARKYMTGFAQIYFPIDLATALERNQMRKRRVEDSVISEMVGRLEQPSTENFWEKYTFVWSEKGTHADNLAQILHLIGEALSNPMMPVYDDTQEVEESRMISSTNLLHQADVVLRKVLGLHIAGSKSVTMSKAERSKLAATCNVVRQQILTDLKNQTILIPHDVSWKKCDASGDADADSPFHLFLKNLFHQRLNQQS